MCLTYEQNLKNILYKIYKYKLIEISLKENIPTINHSNLSFYKDYFKKCEIYLGNEIDKIIIDSIPKGKDGYLLRCEVAKTRNCYFPKLYDSKGNKIKNATDNKYAILLWESHMNNFLIQDIYRLFSNKDFSTFIDSNLNLVFEDINNYIIEYKTSNKIVIKFNDKNELVDIVKEMILNKELDFNYAYELVDLNKLRDEMAKSFAPLKIYSELDKLEDDTKYCLDNFFKFDNDELFNFFINKNNFKYVDSIGLVK